MPAPEYERRWTQATEDTFSAWLRERSERVFGGPGHIQARTLKATARIAAGDFDGLVIDLDGHVAGADATRLANTLARNPHLPLRELLRDASRAQLAHHAVTAVVAHVSPHLDTPVDEVTVGFFLDNGGLLAFDCGTTEGQWVADACAMIQQAFAAMGVLGAPPRPTPPVLVNDEVLGLATTALPEVTRSAVLIRLADDDCLFAADSRLAEGPGTGARPIPEMGAVCVNGLLSYDEPAHGRAGRARLLHVEDGQVWQLVVPVNLARASGERTSHAFARPLQLLAQLGGKLPPSWHLPVAGTTIRCASGAKAHTVRERFLAIHGLSTVFLMDHTANVAAPQAAQRQRTPDA